MSSGFHLFPLLVVLFLGVDGDEVRVLEFADGGNLVGCLGLRSFTSLSEELAENDVLIFSSLSDRDKQLNISIDITLCSTSINHLGIPLVVGKTVVNEGLDLREGGGLELSVSDPPVDVSVV